MDLGVVLSSFIELFLVLILIFVMKCAIIEG